MVKKDAEFGVNRKQRLYWYKTGHNTFCCCGFDHCQKEIADLREFLKSEIKSLCAMKSADIALLSSNPRKGSKLAWLLREKLLAMGAQKNRLTGMRCEGALYPQLRGLEGKRVEVVDKNDEKRRFIVGKSTGWYPIHLEIARRNSTGGGSVTGYPFKSVWVVG